MKILITHDSQSLKDCGFFVDQEYDVKPGIGMTFIGSGWATEVKALVVPENKMMPEPENK